jgi:MFS family permease
LSVAPRIFPGWTIVAGAFAVLFVAYGVQYSFGVFLSALLDEFGWSRASVAGVFSLYATGYCVAGFPAGRLTDRWGPRRVITIGGCLLGSALFGMAFVTRLWQPYLLYGVVGALGMGTAYVPCNATVVKWFVRRRGLATGLAMSGASVGSFVLPLLIQLVITARGWRAAYAVCGAGLTVALVLSARVMRLDPESVGLHPDGDERGPAPGSAPDRGWPVSLAMRTSTFWLLWAAFATSWLPVFVPLVHLPRFSRDLGFSPLVAASVMSALGAGAIAGRLLMGVLSDRIGRKRAVGLAMALQAVAFVGFLGVAGLATLYATAFVYGFAYGAISTLLAAIVGDYFGRAQAGALVGVLFAMAGVISGSGPFVAGAIFDHTGSYTPAFLLSAALSAVSVLFLALCRRPGPPPA